MTLIGWVADVVSLAAMAGSVIYARKAGASARRAEAAVERIRVARLAGSYWWPGVERSTETAPRTQDGITR